MLFFRFDFCSVPTSDDHEKTPTENLGQVNNNNIEFNSYDFDQVDLNQPKGTISTLSRLHEFFLQCYNKTFVTLDIHSPCSVCTSATIYDGCQRSTKCSPSQIATLQWPANFRLFVFNHVQAYI